MKKRFQTGISIILIGLGVFIGILLFFHLTDTSSSITDPSALWTSGTRIFIAVLSVIVIYKLKIQSLAGLSIHQPWKDKWLAYIPSYLLIIGILQIFFLEYDIKTVPFFRIFLITFGVGLMEEVMFRALFLSALLHMLWDKKYGIFWSILISAFIFGGMHLFNLNTVSEPIVVIGQTLYATFFGIFFGVLLLRTNSLILNITIHTLINFVFLTVSFLSGETESGTPLQEAVSSVTVVLPLLIVGLVSIRKIQVEDIRKKIEADASSWF